jgi:hypothetical protein
LDESVAPLGFSSWAVLTLQNCHDTVLNESLSYPNLARWALLAKLDSSSISINKKVAHPTALSLTVVLVMNLRSHRRGDGDTIDFWIDLLLKEINDCLIINISSPKVIFLRMQRGIIKSDLTVIIFDAFNSTHVKQKFNAT